MALSIVLLSLVMSSCGLMSFGDPARPIDLHNATGVTIILYQDAAAPKANTRTVEPGATAESAWLWPITSSDRRVRVVKATDRSGTLLYCQAFTFGELEEISWRVEITKQSPASCP